MNHDFLAFDARVQELEHAQCELTLSNVQLNIDHNISMVRYIFIFIEL